METGLRPNSDYTRTWFRSGEIEYATLADGTRLRYLKAGSGPTGLIMLHTVRTQLDRERVGDPAEQPGQMRPRQLPPYSLFPGASSLRPPLSRHPGGRRIGGLCPIALIR